MKSNFLKFCANCKKHIRKVASKALRFLGRLLLTIGSAMKAVTIFIAYWLSRRPWAQRLRETPQAEQLRHQMEAWKELWDRYQEHFKHFWARRHEIALPDLKAHEAEFLPSALALQSSPISPAGRWIARILMGLIGFCFLWAVLGRMDIIVNASGKIIPSERIKSIAAVETARVDQLYVKEGQNVLAGEMLIELDTRMSDRERDKAAGDRDVALLQIARSRALLASIRDNKLMAMQGLDGIDGSRVADAKNQLESQWFDFAAKRSRLDGEILRYSKQLPLVRQRAKDYQELAKGHDVSVHSWLEKEQDKSELEGKFADATNQRNALIAETKKNAQDVLNEGLKLASASDQDAQRASAHSDLMRLRSPVDGTVQQLTVHTVGGVVPAAQQLMVIVPKQHQVEIEAFVENKDIGFIEAGQRAAVKIETFDYTKYGMVNGTVSHVSRDAIDPNSAAAMNDLQSGKENSKKNQPQSKGAVYSVKVLLDQSKMSIDGRQVLLTPGMSASIEVKTGSRRIIEYFFSPLVQHTHESLNER